MAGKVARYPTTQLRNADFVSQNRSFGRTMEEDDVLNHLSDKSFDKRADILEQLKSMVRRNGGRLPFSNQRNIFKGLSLALNDSNWDVRIKCIQLVHELIPFLDDDLDSCMQILLPQLIPNLGDSKIAVRRAVIQTIHVYMKFTTDVQQILKAIVKYGLESPDSKITKEVTIALPMLFTPEFSHENFYEIAQSLAKRLLDCSMADDGESLQQHVLLSLSKIHNLVGKYPFQGYLDRFSPALRNHYNKLTNEDFETEYPSWTESTAQYGSNGVEASSRKSSQQQMSAPQDGSSLFSSRDEKKEFGIVPSRLMDQLNDQVNFRARAQAVEALKVAINELDDIRALEPHILNFIGFLNNLLDDKNFKIQTATLEILGLLVEKLNAKIKPHLKPIVLALTKCMGDNKIVIRQVIMRVIVKQLMHTLSPKPVLSVVCENLGHRNSRVRQETLNIMIAALLTFPSYDFDLGQLCQTIAHTLIDQKRQVRQAALESFAVLAQAMGAGKLQPLVQAVDSVELSYDGDGVMGAVQARLARRQLPKLNVDNLVDYATPIPNSAGSRGGGKGGASLNLPPAADIEWILQAPSGAGSARPEPRMEMDLVSVPSASNRSSPENFNPEYTGNSGRKLSGKARLPWDAENVEPNRGSNNNRSNSGGVNSPAATTWQHDSPYSAPSPTKPPKIKGQLLNTVPPYDQADAGSYRKTFLDNKFKRQSSDSFTQPFTVYNPTSDADASTCRSSGGGGHYFPPTPRGPPDSNPSFSQSWSDPRMFEGQVGTHNKRLLVPLSGDPYTAAEWMNPVGDVEDDRKNDAPVPTKPSLVRSTSTSRKSGGQKPRKVPPIEQRTSMLVDRADPEVGYVMLGPGGGGGGVLDSARDSALDCGSGLGFMDDADDASGVDEVLSKMEMQSSLSHVRHSAGKKMKSMFPSRSPSPPAVTLRGDTLEESGYLSNLPTTRDPSSATQGDFSEHSVPPFSTSKTKKGRKADAPFSNRPQMIRKPQQQQQQQQQPQQPQQPQQQPQQQAVQQSSADFNFEPHGGATFKSNPSSDVEVIGTRYGGKDQLQQQSPIPAAMSSSPSSVSSTKQASPQLYSNSISKPKKKPQPTKGIVALSPLGVANPFGVGQTPASTNDWDDRLLPTAGISLKGRGVFDSGGNTASLAAAAATSDLTTTPGRRTSRDILGGVNPPLAAGLRGGVRGQQVRHSSNDKIATTHTSSDGDDDDADAETDDDDEDDEEDEEEEEDDVSAMSMTPSARASIAMKARQMEEEAEMRKRETSERIQQRNQAQRLKAAERRRKAEEAASKSNGSTDHTEPGLVISGNASGSNTNTSTVSSCNTHQVTKRPAPVRKFTPAKASAVAAASKGNILSEGQSNRDHGLVNGEPMAYEDLGMFSNPEAALAAALHSIAKEDWLDKCNGLNGIRRLAKHHPETLTNDLPAVALAVMTEAKNLRSSVCRMGAICIGDMCCALKKRMDPSVEKISKLMLTQAGAGASKFLIESAEDALYKMTEYCSPPKVVTGLMFGVGSKNVLVRKSTSTMMAFLVEILTSSRVLTGQKDLTDKVLTSAATFIKDSAPESRYNGQKIFTLLMDDPKFEQQYAKNVPESTRNDIKEKLNNLRRKGLPEPPGEHSSARGRRMEGLASSNVRGHSAHSDQPAHKAGKGPGPRSNATMHDVHEEIQAFTQQMAANDFRERIKAISRFTDQLQKHPGAICNHLTKIFHNFIPCLRDVNSKTALHALCALHEVLPAVANSMGASIPFIVDTVASNLASKNKEISSMAVQVLDAFLNNVEAVQLLQPFVSVAKGGNDRAKTNMVERIAFLSTQVYEEKPKLVKVHVLPLLWSLLGGHAATGIAAGPGGGSAAARDATSHLTLTLYRLMGQELFQAANSTTGVNPRMIQTLRDMVQAT